MQLTECDGGVSVELYVRNELPPPAGDQADAIFARLTELEEQGLLTDVERSTWAKRMPVDDPTEEFRDTYLAFNQWAQTEGVRLTPFFQTRECFSDEHGEMRDWLVVPAFSLAIYEEDDLSAVYPHGDDASTYTVEDGLQSLQCEILSVADPTTATAG